MSSGLLSYDIISFVVVILHSNDIILQNVNKNVCGSLVQSCVAPSKGSAQSKHLSSVGVGSRSPLVSTKKNSSELPTLIFCMAFDL